MSRCSIALSWALVLAGCASTPARVLVMVDSDFSVPTEIDNLLIEVAGPGVDTQSSSASLGGLEDASLPRSLELRQRGEALGPFSVRAAARLGDTVVLERTLEVTFIPGGTFTLNIALNRSCVGVMCASGETCVDAMCVPDDVDAGMPDAMVPDADIPDGGDAGSGPILETDILGTWARAPGGADFGNLYLRRVGTDIRGVYEHQNGRVVSSYDQATTTLDAWWSQTPSRNNANAGPASFLITRVGGSLHAEGTWNRETEPMVINEDWDLDYVGPTIPTAIDPLFMADGDFRDER